MKKVLIISIETFAEYTEKELEEVLKQGLQWNDTIKIVGEIPTFKE